VAVSGTTKRFSCIFIIGALLAILFILSNVCLADKGGWHLSTEPITLNESGQRAIIGWGGESEVLCLATDVSSSRKTTVIEFLPLPSEPKVSLGNKESFEAVERLLARRGVRFPTRVGGGGTKGGTGGSVETEPFHITFHERLGAHGVTVVKVNRPDEFAGWIEEKAKALTQNQASVPDGLSKLITKYLGEYHCPFFVFDVIEVGPDSKSVEPIIYEFKSPVVFYPLEISSTFHGRTTIDLVLFSRYVIDQRHFQKWSFRLSDFAEVNAADMHEVLPQLEWLLGRTAFVQAFRYTGQIDRLRGNITAGPNREHVGYSREQYTRATYRWFYSGIVGGAIGGLLIGFGSLWAMYFSAKRQRPSWLSRLLSGFLSGIPLGSALAFLILFILNMSPARLPVYLWPISPARLPVYLWRAPKVSFIISSM
jgi:hypothetical protein